jgi:hypothetical protein
VLERALRGHNHRTRAELAETLTRDRLERDVREEKVALARQGTRYGKFLAQSVSLTMA